MTGRKTAGMRRYGRILLILLAFLCLFQMKTWAKDVTSQKISKGECYDIVLYRDTDAFSARQAILKTGSPGTKYDVVIYTPSVAQSAIVRLGSTKSETFSVLSTMGGLIPSGRKENDEAPPRRLLGRIYVSRGTVNFSLKGWQDADVSFQPVKETRKSEKKVLQEYTLKKGETVTYTKKEDKGYQLPSLDIILKAKVGTTVTFSGEDWKQTLKFNSASVKATTTKYPSKNNSYLEKPSSSTYKWSYMKKSGSYRYLQYINVLSTGKTSANQNITIYTPYAESLYQTIHKEEKKASGSKKASGTVTCHAQFHSSISDKDVELTYSYSDDWFLKKHTAPDKNIAIASMALAGAAYSESNAKKALEQDGAKFKILKSTFPKPTKKDNDVAGYVIAKRAIGKKNLYLVMVRGTTKNAEWYSNFNIVSDGKKHKGFYKAAGPLLSDIEKYMKQTKKSSNILWITGHSRGAAIASLIAGRISTEPRYQKLADRDCIFGYTFAGPAFSTAADTSLKNIYNYCNEGDMVTQLPPTNYKFRRYGQTITISKSQQSKIKKRFQYLAGEKYNGYMTTPAAVKQMAKWIGKPKDYDKKSKLTIMDYLKAHISSLKKAQFLIRLAGGKSTNFSKYELLQACAVFLQNEDEKTKEAAEKKLAVALATGQLPVKVAAVFLGEKAVKKLTEPKIVLNTPGFAAELAKSPDYIAHAHCQELYFAWMECL